MNWLICITKFVHIPNSRFTQQIKYGYQIASFVFILLFLFMRFCLVGCFKVYKVKDSFRSLLQRLFFYIEKPNKLINNLDNVYLLIILNYFNMSCFFPPNIFSFFVYWINLYFVMILFSLNSQTRHCIAMHNQNQPCLKNKNNNWTHSVFHCLFETNMLIPVLQNIYTFTCIKNTLWERWLFQCQLAEFKRKTTLYFWVKCCEKSLERLFYTI